MLYASATIERLRELRAKPTVALVGSPAPNEYTHQMTSMLARNLAAAGVNVISGVNDGLGVRPASRAKRRRQLNCRDGLRARSLPPE